LQSVTGSGAGEYFAGPVTIHASPVHPDIPERSRVEMVYDISETLQRWVPENDALQIAFPAV